MQFGFASYLKRIIKKEEGKPLLPLEADANLNVFDLLLWYIPPKTLTGALRFLPLAFAFAFGLLVFPFKRKKKSQRVKTKYWQRLKSNKNI